MSVRFAAFAIGIAIITPASAHAEGLDDVQGAWAIQGMECSDVFVTENGRMSLRKRQDDMVPGFIVDGKSIRGGAAECRIASYKPRSDGMSLLLSCETQISFDTLKVTLKIPDADTLIRADDDFPEVTATFNRCK
jgi:hypothetical protein